MAQFMALGVNTSTKRQEDDFYETDPDAAKWLIRIENLNHNIWECACGTGSLAKVFEDMLFNVKSTDLIDRGYGTGNIDFLSQSSVFDGDIVTNPPYKYAEDFVRKALELVPEGNKVCMFLKIQFLESLSRRKLFEEYPPKRVWVSTHRISCGKNIGPRIPNTMCFAWFIWEKGYKGNTEIKWFN